MQGSELKALRKALGMTQAEFATELGITQTFVSMMESGKNPIERRTILAAKYLELVQRVGGQDTPDMPSATK